MLSQAVFQESYHILCYGPIQEGPLWGKIIIKISHLLITLSSALNIIIYSYKVSLRLDILFQFKRLIYRISNFEQC